MDIEVQLCATRIFAEGRVAVSKGANIKQWMLAGRAGGKMMAAGPAIDQVTPFAYESFDPWQKQSDVFFLTENEN